jgi:hypothetical protein
MLDERTRLKFTNFYQTKNGMVEPTCVQFHKWKLNNMPVKYVQMDGASENKKLKSQSDSSIWKLNIQYEITARDTLQQNHLLELAFANLANRGRALMHQANLPLAMQYKVFKEAFQTATQLDGRMAIKVDGKVATRYIHFFGSNPKFVNHLCTWGETRMVNTKTKVTPNITDRGIQCMFVAYTLNHTGNIYRMWDPTTSPVHETCDIIWMKKQMYYSKPELHHDYAIVIRHPSRTPTAQSWGDYTTV